MGSQRSLEAERKKIEDEAAESLKQIMAVKKQVQAEQLKSQGAKKLSENKHDEMSPTKVIVVNSNSFVPQKNTKHEIGVIKMGSPSQIRRAVKMEVKIEESESSSEIGRGPRVENYQITKVPTTSFELKKPQA